MNYLFEQCNLNNSPFEAFLFDASKNTFPIRPHMHYFMELIYILEEPTLISTPTKDYLLQEGEFILLSPYMIHSIYSHSKNPPKYNVIKFDINHLHLTSNHMPKLSALFSNSQEHLNPIIILEKDLSNKLNIRHYFDLCLQEISRHEIGYDIRIQSSLIDLLIQIIRLHSTIDTNSSNRFIPTSSLSKNFILRLPEYIDAHSQEVIKVEDLAKMCNMSYSNFAKNFKKLYGKSCKSYIEYVKINKTKDFLIFTDYDLTYISQECGFSDSSHFIRTFRKITDITPNQFRINNTTKKETIEG